MTYVGPTSIRGSQIYTPIASNPFKQFHTFFIASLSLFCHLIFTSSRSLWWWRVTTPGGRASGTCCRAMCCATPSAACVNNTAWLSLTRTSRAIKLRWLTFEPKTALKKKKKRKKKEEVSFSLNTHNSHTRYTTHYPCACMETFPCLNYTIKKKLTKKAKFADCFWHICDLETRAK